KSNNRKRTPELTSQTNALNPVRTGAVATAPPSNDTKRHQVHSWQPGRLVPLRELGPRLCVPPFRVVCLFQILGKSDVSQKYRSIITSLAERAFHVYDSSIQPVRLQAIVINRHQKAPCRRLPTFLAGTWQGGLGRASGLFRLTTEFRVAGSRIAVGRHVA